MKKREKYAVRSYLFGKNYRDLWDTIAGSFRGTYNSGANAFRHIIDPETPMIFSRILMTVYYAVLMVAIFTFGFIFTTIFSILHVIVVTIMMTFVYLVFVFFAGLDKLYRTIKQISNTCPSCQRKYSLPVYHCPTCGAPHRYLYPSSYGIFYHKCTCGTKLPTLLINGRHKLEGTCPLCDAPAFKGINHSTIFPVFGGRSCGKTCFINSAISEIERMAPSLKAQFNYYYGVANDDRLAIKERMEQGYLPDSTHENNLKFYNFTFTPNGKKRIANFISVCDINGETFQQRERISKQVGYRYADSIIFVLDPLAITEFRDEVINQGYDVASYAGSDQEISDILGAMLTTLEEMHRKKKTKINLIVAFTKGDLEPFDKILGQKAVDAYAKAKKGLSKMEARDALAQKFLMDYGESNALKLIQNYFSSVHYFVTSAVGKNHEDGASFEPIDTAYPLLWVIDEAYKNLNFDKQLWKGVK